NSRSSCKLLGNDPALDLARRRARDRLYDVDNFRNLKIRQQRFAMCDQLAVGRRRAEHHRGGNRLSIYPVGDAEANRFGDCRVSEQRFVYFARRDLFTSAIDQLLYAADQRQVSVGVQVPLVACPEPSVGERIGVSLWIPFVSAKDVWAFNRYLSVDA